MGALEHSSNVIWHAASAHSLGAKILCTLLNVHKLVSLLRITPTGKSCWWWGFSYCLQTTLTSKSKWIASRIHWVACAHAHLCMDAHPPCMTATSAFVCVFVCVMQSDNGPVGVLPLADKLHFMNTQWTSFIKSFSSKKGSRTNILRQYTADESNLLSCPGITLCVVDTAG